MRFAIGGVRLDDIIGGTLLAGTIPFPRLLRSVLSTENAGAVTVTAAGTVIVTIDLGTLILDDYILAAWHLGATKGATAGLTTVEVSKNSGVGVVGWIHDDTFPSNNSFGVPATNVFRDTGMQIGKVTTGGTFVARLRGVSAGSDSTVAIGGGQLWVAVLAGS